MGVGVGQNLISKATSVFDVLFDVLWFFCVILKSSAL